MCSKSEAKVASNSRHLVPLMGTALTLLLGSLLMLHMVVEQLI